MTSLVLNNRAQVLFRIQFSLNRDQCQHNFSFWILREISHSIVATGPIGCKKQTATRPQHMKDYAKISTLAALFCTTAYSS